MLKFWRVMYFVVFSGSIVQLYSYWFGKSEPSVITISCWGIIFVLTMFTSFLQTFTNNEEDPK